MKKINRVWYCDYKLTDYEKTQRRIDSGYYDVNVVSVSIKEMVDEYLSHFNENQKEKIIKYLDVCWKYVSKTDEEFRLYWRFWNIVCRELEYLRRDGKEEIIKKKWGK